MNAPIETAPSRDSLTGIPSELLGRVLDGTSAFLANHGEAVVFGLLTILIGWLLAVVLRHFSTRLLRAIGLDVFADRIGIKSYLERRELPGRPSVAVGWVLYLVIFYTAFVLAFDRMGLEAAARFLTTVAGFLPHLLVAAVLLLLGLLLAGLARTASIAGARLLGLPAPDLFGAGARLSVLLLALVVTLDYLGFASTTILLGGLGVLLFAGLASGLIFAFSARRLAESLLARGFLTATYRPGQQIRLPGVEGTIIRIDSTLTVVRGSEGEFVLPNRRLHEATVLLLPGNPGPAGSGKDV
ncbi:MAG: hypothetical protein EA425_05220 [Puniceicoccaceae bacterium]|nr:MAG: hypothetical protein EA425_05220 [Puniceicoccaceae bacterium]